MSHYQSINFSQLDDRIASAEARAQAPAVSAMFRHMIPMARLAVNDTNKTASNLSLANSVVDETSRHTSADGYFRKLFRDFRKFDSVRDAWNTAA